MAGVASMRNDFISFVEWASCCGMGILLWNGHLVVEWASCPFPASGGEDAHPTYIHALIQPCGIATGVVSFIRGHFGVKALPTNHYTLFYSSIFSKSRYVLAWIFALLCIIFE
ncbi:MAG: hypothetical protein F6K50_00010 [Moorea sp. SIO3I7]|uniref:hypothetical protein n=1 Tax=Moorena sp. SIO3I8 TaxID=2607833 RepID=UPI0013C1B05B|nr:hypothetical protein [Moorena sp. SIO3I8]NEN94002.1 hypothetical protein [Moorena sp. SIO3I7]NEO05205.1 hypothetical protein [Moorena sp. SIO3I8]